MFSFQSLLSQISVSESDFSSDASSTDLLFENNKYEWDALFLNKENGFSSISVNSNDFNEKENQIVLSKNNNCQNELTEKTKKRNRKFIRVSEFKLENDFLDEGKILKFLLLRNVLGNERKEDTVEEI